jgi:cholesterol oxidase
VISLRFTETMKGYVALGERDFERGYAEGRRLGTPLSMRLDLAAGDLEAFLRSRDRTLEIVGEVCFPPLGTLPATGTVNQLIGVRGRLPREAMPYHLELSDADGRRLRLAARKTVFDEHGAWQETTTLYVHLLRDGDREPIAAGIVRIGLLAFLRQFPTYRLSGGSRLQRLRAFPRFYGSFLARLWRVYGFPLAGR